MGYAIRSIYLIFVLAGIVSVEAMPPDELRVLVVYTEEAKERIEDTTEAIFITANHSIDEHAARNVEIVNDILEQNQLDNEVTVVTAGVVVPANYNVDGSASPPLNPATHGEGSYQNVAGDFNNHADEIVDANGISIAQHMEDTMADLVYVVTRVSGPLCCGAVESILGSKPGDNVNGNPENYTMSVYEGNITGDTWAHELLHLLGVRHENDPNPTVLQQKAKAYILRDANNQILGCTVGVSGPGCPMSKRTPWISSGDPNDRMIVNNQDLGPRGDDEHRAMDTIRTTLRWLAKYYEWRGSPPLPLAAPGLPTFRAELESCSGWLADLIITWWPNPDVGGPPTSFEVEYTDVWPHYPDDWTSLHDGGPMCVPFTADATVTRFRVKAFNAAGESDWKYDSFSHNCTSGGIGW